MSGRRCEVGYDPGGAVNTINTLMGPGSLLAAVAMIAIGLGTVAVNAMNDYTGSLSLQAAGVRVPRVWAAVAVAVLGFFFTLYLHDGNLVTKFEGYLLFIIYWVTPYIGVVLADWWLRGRRADVSRLADFASLPSGIVGLLALVVGFVVSLPFGTSPFGQQIADATGLPINAFAPTFHFADIAYVVGFIVSFAFYWVFARSSVQRA